MRVYLALTVLGLGIVAACTSSQTGGREEVGGSGAASGAGNGTTAANPATVTGGLIPTTTTGGPTGCVGDECLKAPPGCGDANLTPDEACDDGNTVSGDGCTANCLVVEEGFSCQPPGQACRFLAVCGDGFRSPSEGCDDGNVVPGDGCSERCNIEDFFKCDMAVPNFCSATMCGDGVPEGSESCDDGNAFPYDGCSANCRAEPNCAGATCVSSCGDGLLLGEACDDGNLIDGDGCSSACTVEPGFDCSQQVTQLSDVINGFNVLRVPVIYRDFTTGHSDFGTTKEANGCDGWVQNIVSPTLMNGKPVLAGASNPAACIASAASFAQWYTDVPGTNAAIPGELVLFQKADGGFVNRHGPNGEQFQGAPTEVVVDCNSGERDIVNVPTACATRCTLDAHETCYENGCTPWGDSAQICKQIPANVLLDGTPLFFPLDGHPQALPDTLTAARIPEQYGWNSWPPEVEVTGVNGMHNFNFTTEVHYWFKYDPTTAPTFAFTGDDDVWVFLNNQLIIDLGGIHVPISGQFTLDAATAANFGLVEGQVYEISVFQAERRPEGSSFRLTLEGFSTARTECVPICGDGIVSAGEECDDGVNDGGYGECEAGCVIGPHCGDGVVDAGFEDCDDGNRREGDLCGSACRNLAIPK